MIIHLIIVGIIMYFIMRWIQRKFPDVPPNEDAAFLAMCCRRLNTNITEVFKIAAEHSGLFLDDRIIAKDVKFFLHGEETIPFYVRKFIDDGRKEIKD